MCYLWQCNIKNREKPVDNLSVYAYSSSHLRATSLSRYVTESIGH